MRDRKQIILSIRKTWVSLNSHLGEAIVLSEKKKCCQKAIGSPAFHRKAIKEYGQIIKTLTDAL